MTSLKSLDGRHYCRAAILLAIATVAALPAIGLATTTEVASAISAYVSHYAWLRVFAAPDGTFWVVTQKARAGETPSLPPAVHRASPLVHIDKSERITTDDDAFVRAPLSRRGPAIHMRHLDVHGKQLGRVIILTDVPELDEIDGVELLGFGPNGSFYLWCISGNLDPVWDCIALVDSSGVRAVSPRPATRNWGYPPTFSRSVVSSTGLLRVFDGFGPRLESYLVTPVNSHLAIADYRPTEDETPAYAKWHGRHAFAPAGADKLLAAVDRNGHSLSLYRLNMESMSFIDSGVVQHSETLYSLDTPHVPDRTVLVPSDSGFWLYMPLSDTWSQFLTPDETAKRVVVFSISRSLKPRPPVHSESRTMQPFTSAGPDAVRVVQVNMMDPSPTLGQRAGLHFWAYGADGRLYHSAESITLRGPFR